MTTVWCLLSPILLFAISALQTEALAAKVKPSQCVNGTFVKSASADEGHRCVADCGPGLYADVSSRECRSCEPPCLTCAGVAQNCSSCSEPNFLLGNRCVMNCGSQLSRGPARNRLRLNGGRNAFEGRVEILHEGVWGSICDDQWDLQDAAVVCRELQLGSAVEALSVSKTNIELASERMPIHLDDVTCRGTEPEMEFCPDLVWGRHNCAHNEDAVVRCSGPDRSRLCVRSCGDGYYRVPGTNKCELCSPECLTCSERAERCLSCQGPRFLLDESCVKNCGNGHHGNTDSRTCEPCHENCNNCNDGPSNSVCSSCKDHLFLDGRKCVESCDPKLSKNLAIRLVGGATAYEGRVEVYIDGEWGTVCDDGWDINDAEVVCRELGYGSALAAYPSSTYGQGTGPIALNRVQCSGSEEELVHCPQNPWRENYCSHNEDAGVRCEGEQSIVTSWVIVAPTLTHPGATGKCLDSCGTGYYLPAISEYDCATCSSNCLSCEVMADRCTSCKPSKFLKGSDCVESCGPTEFGNTLTNRCELCDISNCETCQDGPQNDHCKTCPRGKVLKGTSCAQTCGPDMYSQSDVCQGECNHGFYGNLASFICQTCSSQCLTCEFNREFTLVCKTCRAPKILHNGECVDSCPGTMLKAPMDPSLVPFSNEIRLVGGRDQLEGRLEVFYDGQWGTVCSDHWSITSARVACKQLHLGPAEAITTSMPWFKPGQGIIWLDNVYCRGTESSLDECKHNEWGDHNCNHLKDVALRCSGPGIRQCVTTCPRGYFAQSETGQCVPCLAGCMNCENTTTYRCLQCPPGTLLQADSHCVDECSVGYHPDGSSGRCSPCSDICATCVSHADNCTSCKGELILEGHTCVPQCDGYKLVLTDQVRLVGGDSPLEGRVEVLYMGKFGTVCDDQWGLEDADVVCAQMGLGRALKATRRASHGYGTGVIVLDNVECRGDEPSIFACQHDGLGVNDCQHNEDAGVLCSGPVTSNICIQRSACSSGLYVAADGVTCNKCSYNCKACSGSANNCTSCPDDQYLGNDHSCINRCPVGFYGDAAKNCLRCSDECLGCSEIATQCTSCSSPLYLQSGQCVTACASDKVTRRAPPDIRLANGRNRFSGRVEVLFNGAWGTVCDDQFDVNEAKVICRQLQMGTAIDAYTHAHFGEGAGSIVLDQMACNGDEESLVDCMGHRLGTDEVDCQHREDAGVQCSGPGMAQHCLTECGQGYYASSDMVCEHCDPLCHLCEGSPSQCLSCVTPLFLFNNTCAETCPSGQYGNTATRTCQPCNQECLECFEGTNGSICKSCKDGFYLDGSSCVTHCRQASVLENILPQPTSSAPIRLAGGTETEGRVEIFHEGKWGTICADNWDKIDGEVVCQQLGLGHLLGIPASTAYGNKAIDAPIWLDSVECKGWEFALSQCSHEGWGVGHCQLALAGGDAAVQCSGSSTPRPSKNICRSVTTAPCQQDTCSSGTACVDLDGGNSVCMECPEGQIGTGKECTMVAGVPPEFELFPENRLATIGNPASLNCRARDGSAPTVTAQNWLKDGKPISQMDLDNGRIRIWNFGTMYMTATRREDTGNYTCLLRNTQGTSVASAILTVEEPPQIMQKHDAIAATSDSATLTCSVVGLPTSTVSWRYAGKPVNDKRFTSFSENGTLVIRDVKPEDEGEYQCFAENKKGSAHTTVTLTVYEPPQFTAMPKEITEVERGESVSLQCQAKGKPEPRIHWKKDGNELPHIEDRFFVTSAGDLKLVNVDLLDMGVYNCIAVNSVQTKSLSAKLLVNGPPQFVATPSNHTVSTGETVLLKCMVIGAKDPVISWEKDGQPITNGDHYSVRDDGLQIKSVSPEDVGEYKCIGTNAQGNVESTAYISFHAPVIGKQKTVSGVWIYITIIALLIVIIFVIVVVYVRCRYKEKAQFNHSRLNKSPKKLVTALGVKFTGGNNYVEIDKQKSKSKEEREMQTRGIMEDVDVV